MNIELPEFALVVLLGASGSGKSSFAARHFLSTEVLSSDHFRALVSDDETSQDATRDAFDALHYLAAVRLRRRKLVVVDATNVQESARKPCWTLPPVHAVPVAIALDVPEKVCHARNQTGRTATSAATSSSGTCATCGAASKTCGREGFATVPSGYEAAINAAESRACRCGPTNETSPGRSTSSATFTAVVTNCARS
jgi:predicted kinase